MQQFDKILLIITDFKISNLDKFCDNYNNLKIKLQLDLERIRTDNG